jgi:hypothetical protein
MLGIFAYDLVHPQTDEERPKIAAFRTWTLGAVAGKVVGSDTRAA